jgi:hypothetical protein
MLPCIFVTRTTHYVIGLNATSQFKWRAPISFSASRLQQPWVMGPYRLTCTVQGVINLLSWFKAKQRPIRSTTCGRP